VFSATVATCSAAIRSRASTSPRDAANCAFATSPAVTFRLTRGAVYIAAVTVGREASTAGVSTTASGATVSGVVSKIASLSDWVISVTASSSVSAADAATLVTAAESNAAA